jgi:hypothetical protein
LELEVGSWKFEAAADFAVLYASVPGDDLADGDIDSRCVVEKEEL